MPSRTAASKATPSKTGKRRQTMRSPHGQPARPYKVTSKGRVYFYAWRGGPRLPDPAVDMAAFQMAFAAALADRAAPATPTTLADLCALYQNSPECAALAPSTRAIRLGRLATISQDRIGRLPILALEARAAPAMLVRFRDQRAATPRAADEHIEAISVVINWAMVRGWITRNPAARIPALYRRGAHAANIWEVKDLDALKQHLPPIAAPAVALAVATGLRRGDLCSLDWSEIDMARRMIRKATAKSRGKAVAWIPLTDIAHSVLMMLGPQTSGPVLTALKGKRWHPPELTETIHKAAKAAGIARRLNDFRGTYATQLYAAGLTYEEIEERMGWEPGQARLRRRDYAREESVMAALAERLKSFAADS